MKDMQAVFLFLTRVARRARVAAEETMSDELVRFLVDVPKMCRRIRRWTHIDAIGDDERETVETHQLSHVYLGGAMLALERVHGGPHRPPVNGERVIMALSVHDVGEGRIGDVAYYVKSHPLLKDPLATVEREEAAALFAALPPAIRAAYEDAFAVEKENPRTPDGRFFNAVERIGYMQAAVPWHRRGVTEVVPKVFRHQHKDLLRHAEEFVSARILYEPYKDEVAAALREHGFHDALP